MSRSPIRDAEYEAAFFHLAKRIAVNRGKLDIIREWGVLSKYHENLMAMLSVLTAFKHALIFGASTALCENSFSTLKKRFYGPQTHNGP